MVERLNGLPGVSANRVPLSGACAGYKGDIRAFIDALGRPLVCEVKARARADGWCVVKQWLADNDLLFLIEDYQEPLVVMPFSLLANLVGTHAEKKTD